MEKGLSSVRAPIGLLAPSPSSSSSSSATNQRSSQLGFPVSPSTCRRFKPLRVSLSNTEVKDAQEMRNGHTEEPVDLESFSILALSPLDGRYVQKVKELRPFFSEYGLIRYRVVVEVKWLQKLSQIPGIKEVPNFSSSAQSYLESIIHDFDKDDALEVKKIEKVTNHDVKAVEYFLKQKCKSNPEIAKVLEFFHFACTSEDINNLAHALALKEAFHAVIFPVMMELVKALCVLSKENAHMPMLSRTHGQPASPTTLGKEMANFAFRLSNIGKTFSEVEILGKFAGAVGNYNAHKVAYPDINWQSISAEFVKSLGIGFNPYVTQAHIPVMADTADIDDIDTETHWLLSISVPRF